MLFLAAILLVLLPLLSCLQTAEAETLKVQNLDTGAFNVRSLQDEALEEEALKAKALDIESLEEDTGLHCVQMSSLSSSHPIAIINVPNLEWSDVSEVSTPNLYYLVGSSGAANLSTPLDDVRYALSTEQDIAWFSLPDDADLSKADQILGESLGRFGEAWTVLIVNDATLFPGNQIAPTREFTPIIAVGKGFNGYLTSETTWRLGLVSSRDIGYMVHHLNDSPDSPSYTNLTIGNQPSTDSSGQRIAELKYQRSLISGIANTKYITDMAFLLLVFSTFGISLILLFLGKRDRPGSRRIFIPIVRILWIIVLSFPPACFLMFLTIPPGTSEILFPLICLAWTGVLALSALAIGRLTKWFHAIVTLFALTILVLVIGQIFGGPLDTASYLSYDITEGSRYYGMGNEQCALMFGSWITLAGLLINRFGENRWIVHFRKWMFPLGSLLLLVVTCSPWLGASFGPLIWATTGCFVAWWLYNGRHFRWWMLLLVSMAAFGLAVGVLYLDVNLNSLSHMSWVAGPMQQGPFIFTVDLLKEVWRVSVTTMTAHVPATAIVFGLSIIAFLVVLRVLKPGSYREFWQRNPVFRSAYSICLLMALITFFLEDSGMFTPAVLMIYPISALVWLVCDLHRWHVSFLRRTDQHLSIGQLQKNAISRDREDRLHSRAGLPGSTGADTSQRGKHYGKHARID
ncbi:MAG: hypothetical protein LBH87_02985, partial [Coriobacteriales bacterium]|nr:hypothetical protein [Coriobacteriales bacterium]